MQAIELILIFGGVYCYFPGLFSDTPFRIIPAEFISEMSFPFVRPPHCRSGRRKQLKRPNDTEQSADLRIRPNFFLYLLDKSPLRTILPASKVIFTDSVGSDMEMCDLTNNI